MQGQNSQKQLSHLQKPQLCNSKYFDLPTELEILMYKNHKEYLKLVEQDNDKAPLQAGTISIELMNKLQKFVSQSELNHTKMMQGILFGLLTLNQINDINYYRQTQIQRMANVNHEQQNQMKEQLWNTLSQLVRDNYRTFCHLIKQLIYESYDHLKN